MKTLKVRDIMSRSIVTVDAGDSVESAAELFGKYGYAGIPVVDGGKKLVGILTEYDMVAHSSGVHIPTVLSILSKIPVERKDSGELRDYFRSLKSIKVKDVMNGDPLTIDGEKSVDEVAREFAEHHKVNPIPVVDGEGNLVGVVSRHDIIRIFNERYLHNVLEDQGRHPEAMMRLGRRTTERIASGLVSLISDKFMIVNKDRPRMWKILAMFSFLIGFIVAMVWILNVVFK